MVCPLHIVDRQGVIQKAALNVLRVHCEAAGSFILEFRRLLINLLEAVIAFHCSIFHLLILRQIVYLMSRLIGLS